ncbi:oligomeric Golgi complex subunit 3 [Parastagonospora nodorum]|nr:oligomeric Golgi complex subunit 3 [Parastagonospora nodorum]KAH4374019.1 oligomeric Golgi complex subunit 3 [Parastagonospora nodorum]KAH4421210.1 oligomeric Golgi complex subunit 3 [Parastagonospora nodorum]KAH5153972.1 oligomeric Golgi complex subunit 3 [Parastagonospora nodorum]KAH5253452.1 oligomeric Golgi complex subunit 3 [Parastagonospora nodorum]
MDAESWFSFVPRSTSTKAPDNGKHKRRVSMLKQPNEAQADVERAEAIPEAVDEVPGKLNGPPQATVARRAKSYSDFYAAVRAHVKREKALEKKKSRENLSTELEFAEWYGGVHDELLEASHEEYRLYQSQLHMARSHLGNIISDTTSTLDILSSLSSSFKAVEAQTTAFRTQCEGLISDQTRITKLAEDMGQNLRYYMYLEPTTKRLNAPGAGKIVRSNEFTEMLANLDSCLEYMQAHSKHKEAETYRSRYRLLLTRALTLTRVHFTEALRETAADVSKRIADRQLNDTTMSALLYAKFRVGAPELKSIGLEIQKRAVLPKGAAPGTEAEYQSLMNELYQSYSTTRGRLILPIISKKINEIAQAPSTSKDLVSFARSSISYLRDICMDECELWREWFEGDGGLYDFLEAMCEPLYDHLRPRTIHETQILKLCELCTMIQTRYMEKDEDEEEEVDTKKLDFSILVHPALEDAQNRLVFLSLAVLRDDIERYKPKPEDLDYPAKHKKLAASSGKSNQPALSGKRQPKSEAPPTPLMPKTPTVVEEDDPDSRWNFNTEAAFKDWYPTLRKAIWLLSKIYRLVHSSVFDDLAHHIVHSTTVSLTQASALLTKSTSPTDAALFLVSHLLLLKQQIVAFDIEFVTPETEVQYNMTSITNTFWELRSRGGLFNPRNLVGLLIPKVVENMLDAKAEVDARLRQAINDFTGQFVTRMTAPIDTKNGKKVPVGEAPARTAKIRQNIEHEVPFLRTKLEEYITDHRTREMLVAAVMESVTQTYEEWFDTSYTPSIAGSNGVGRSTKGKGREDGVWDPDVFNEWCNSTFKVGTLGLGMEDGSDDEDNEDDGSSAGSMRTGTDRVGLGLSIKM